MKKIVLATTNHDKFREIKDIWKDTDVGRIDWIGNSQGLKKVEENGNTLRENAAIKARYVSGTLNCPALADDTGLFVEYLNGAPGVFSSRFAGKNATYEENVEKLLDKLKGVPRKKRVAEFCCVVCLSQAGKEDIFTEGIVEGYITDKKRGENGFGYDPVFEVKETGKTYAEMTLEEKNTLSHRYLAFKKMRKIIA